MVAYRRQPTFSTQSSQMLQQVASLASLQAHRAWDEIAIRAAAARKRLEKLAGHQPAPITPEVGASITLINWGRRASSPSGLTNDSPTTAVERPQIVGWASPKAAQPNLKKRRSLVRLAVDTALLPMTITSNVASSAAHLLWSLSPTLSGRTLQFADASVSSNSIKGSLKFGVQKSISTAFAVARPGNILLTKQPTLPTGESLPPRTTHLPFLVALFRNLLV